MKTHSVALAGLFAAFTAAGAQVSIPLGPVPITLQTFFVLLSALIGGPVVGFLSQIIYLLLGSTGLPVFAGFRGGFSVFFGPTAGYLIAFPPAALVAGLIFHRLRSGVVLRGALSIIAAEAIIYVVGVPWLAAWFSAVRGLTAIDALSRAVMSGALIFLPGDALKAAIALYVATRRSIREIVRDIKA